MTAKKTYDIFITHAWRYHDDWTRVSRLFDGLEGLSWRNFSVPWHDPAMDPNTEVGGQFVRNWLESQIIPVHGVIFLGSVYAVKSTRKWLDLETEMARKHKKPIVGVPAYGEDTVPPEVQALVDEVVGWDAAQIIATFDKLAASGERQ